MKTFRLHLHLTGSMLAMILAGFILVCIGVPSRSDCMEQNDEEMKGSTPPRFELEEIVVTAAKVESPVKSVPKNVTVITREDIEQAPSNNIVDLLNREAGVNLRSLFGSDKQAVIDVRGMGATAGSNVLVMVDGVRMNSSDMSGVDFSSILLEQVERIEIIRGAGSVIYGDGAVGGVINIITRRGKAQAEQRIYASYGSYSTADLRASAGGSVHDMRYNLSAGYFDSDGYRENGDFEKKNIAGVADFFLNDAITLSASGAYHGDRYGLPGPVSISAKDSREERVKSEFPDDYGETTDARVSGGVEFDMNAVGSIKVVRGYRLRNNDFVVGASSLIPEKDQVSEIEEFDKTLNLTYDLDVELFRRFHKFQIGIDHYYTDYVREEAPGGPRINSETTQIGFYVTDQWSLAEPVLLHWGYRENRFDGKFRTDQLVSLEDGNRWVNGPTENREWRNNAYDLGLTYFYSEKVILFSSYGTSFRIPNADEFAESETGLEPQKGREWDVGARIRVSDRMEVSVTLFHITTEDEIYYSEINRNYQDTTVRQGVETDIRFYAGQALYLWGNYSYTSATFEDSNNDVPLVPRHKGSAGIQWAALDDLTLSISGTYVGSRYDGNDIDNDRYERLDAYSVFDAKITYQHNKGKLFAGINNLFDSLYETYAYSERYYPMPERNVYAGLEWMF